MANGAQAAQPSETYRVLRELGHRSQRSFAAIRQRSELLVLHRWSASTDKPSGERLTSVEHVTSGVVTKEQMALLLRNARCLAKNWHPNIARVRYADVTSSSELEIATELLDGATLEELIDAAKAKRAKESDPLLPHAVLARIFVDVLGGLHGLHALRDGIQAPLGCFHGELAPANVVDGKDGVARIVNCFRPHPVQIAASSEALGYASPETLACETQDARSDLFAVGVMLWESLMGRRLYADADPIRIAQRQREEDLAIPDLGEASPFAQLPAIALRALSFDPALRFRSASEMATEIRKVAGTRLAPGTAVAQIVQGLVGERVKNRRADLDPSVSGSRRRSSKSPSAAPGTDPDPKTGSASTNIPLAAITRLPIAPIDDDPLGGDRPTLDAPLSSQTHPTPTGEGEKKIVVSTRDAFVPATLPKPSFGPREAPRPPQPTPTPLELEAEDLTDVAEEAPPSSQGRASDAKALAAALEIVVSPKSLKPSDPPPFAPSVIVAPQSEPKPVLAPPPPPSVPQDLLPPSEPRIELQPPTDPRCVDTISTRTPEELIVSLPPPRSRRFVPLVGGIVGVCVVATLAALALFTLQKADSATTTTTSPYRATATAATVAPPSTVVTAPTTTAIEPPPTPATTTTSEEPKPAPTPIVTAEPRRPTTSAPPVAPRPAVPPRPAGKKKPFEPQGI